MWQYTRPLCGRTHLAVHMHSRWHPVRGAPRGLPRRAFRGAACITAAEAHGAAVEGAERPGDGMPRGHRYVYRLTTVCSQHGGLRVGA